MNNPMDNSDDQAFQKNMMASFVQIATLVILVTYCVIIISPFAGLAIWGIVMAVAIYPLFLKLCAKLGDRRKLTATLFVVVGLAVVLIPGWAMTKSSIISLTEFSTELRAGSVEIPPPSDSVADWLTLLDYDPENVVRVAPVSVEEREPTAGTGNII